MYAITVRFEDDVASELDEMSNVLGMTKNSIINTAVRQQYDSLIGGDPKVREAIDKLNEFKRILEDFQTKFEK